MNADTPGNVARRSVLLPTEVVLAKRTGGDDSAGRAQSGEGLIGPRWALLVAGAETVIPSLWSVKDRSTAERMKRFYSNLWVEGPGPSEALRNAQFCSPSGAIRSSAPGQRGRLRALRRVTLTSVGGATDGSDADQAFGTEDLARVW